MYKHLNIAYLPPYCKKNKPVRLGNLGNILFSFPWENVYDWVWKREVQGCKLWCVCVCKYEWETERERKQNRDTEKENERLGDREIQGKKQWDKLR